MKNRIILVVRVLIILIAIVVNIWRIRCFQDVYLGTIACGNCSSRLYNIEEGDHCKNCGISLKVGNIGVRNKMYCPKCRSDNIGSKFCQKCGSEIQAVYVDTDYDYKDILRSSQNNIIEFMFMLVFCDVVVLFIIVVVLSDIKNE